MHIRIMENYIVPGHALIIERIRSDMGCKHCTDGKINEYGDEWFAHFECKTCGALYRERPRITKRNNRYFLHVDDGLSMIPIKACPICGRSLEIKEDIHE